MSPENTPQPGRGLTGRVLRGIDGIAERRISEAAEEGFFDNLPGHGKPIADLHRQRQDGWWATRLVRNERAQAKRDELREYLRDVKKAVWQADGADQVRAIVAEANAIIEDHNVVTAPSELEPFPLLDAADEIGVWQRRRQALASAGPLAAPKTKRTWY